MLTSLNNVVVALDLFGVVRLNPPAFFTTVFVAQSDSRFAVRHVPEKRLLRSAYVAGNNEIPFVRLTFG